MNKKYLWIGGAALLAVAATAAIVINTRGDELEEVQTATVERQKIVQKVNATGRIQPKLDRERYLAQVESAEANVRSAQAEAKLVRENMIKTSKEYDRSSELVRRGLESQAVLDTQQAAYQVEIARHESALDKVEQAKAALKQAQDALAKTTIYAPMAGTISDLRKEQGEIAIGSQFQEDVILVVSDLTEMEAQVNVDENDIVSVEIGQEAEIEVDALFNQTLTGRVYEIANTANIGEEGTTDQKTEFEVKITIIDPLASLRPGMTASADIFAKTKERALSVPIQSVAVRTLDQLTREGESREDAEKLYTPDRDGFVEIVFCIEGDTAVAKQVTTGIQSDNLIEILSGLGENEQVVTGSYRAISKDLVNGAEVTVNNDPDRETDDG
jgi:HlyD family secretion protein